MIIERLKELEDMLTRNGIKFTTSILRQGYAVEKAEVVVSLHLHAKNAPSGSF